MELIVRAAETVSPATQPVEVVERKGLGHPDSICDALAEQICVALCRHYRDRFGVILHHNVDKILLRGGGARPRFGGGAVTAPIELYLAGRATGDHGGETVPISAIAVDACTTWLGARLPRLDLARDVRFVPLIRPGSGDLTRLFARGAASAAALANDTSCGAGFAPLTDLERTVLAVERALNDPATHRNHPSIGEDVKVMGVRRGSCIELTIGCAIVDRVVADLAAYARAKAVVAELATAAAHRVTRLDVEVLVNAADDLERGDVFLTVTGTSAEAGDDGEVGRGNRTSGLITPYRPMTLEAAAGKNPVSHVGKLYNLVASRVAADLVRDVPGVTAAAVVLVSQIGRPVVDPRIADVAVTLERGLRLDHVTARAEALLRHELGALDALREELLAGTVDVY